MNYSFHTNTGVSLLWRNMQYPNNSIVNIEGVGEGVDAMACQTDRRPCCGTRPNRFGEWYYPNGSRVPIEAEGALFYRTRRDGGLVLLHQRNHNIITASSTSGLFCCELPDANDINQTLCIGLLPIGNIGGTIKLLCISARSHAIGMIIELYV